MLFQRAGALSCLFSFSQNSNPAQDLERVPPGLLALDNMLYFSRNAPSAYSRVSDGMGWVEQDAHLSRVPMGLAMTPCPILCSYYPSLCWRTAAVRTNMSAPLPGAVSS